MAKRRLPRITPENYFSPEINMAYMSASQFKSFLSCEARALAEAKGEWANEPTTALLVGSYVDSYMEGEEAFSRFKEEHSDEIYNVKLLENETTRERVAEVAPELFTKTGNWKSGALTTARELYPDFFTLSKELKADFREAEKIIEVIKADPLMQKYLVAGKKQVIVKGFIEGVPVKGKLDSHHPGKAIVDGKVMKDFEPMWVPDLGKVNFVRAWGYDYQGAFYQEAEMQTFKTDHKLPFFIAGVTKQDEPDKAVIRIPDGLLDSALEVIKSNIVHFDEVKRGIVPAQRCEKCAYCRATKVLKRVQTLDEFDPEL